MKTKKEDFFSEILKLFLEIKALYPTAPLSNHLSVILEDYPDLWGTSDKEIVYAVTKYKARLEMDVPHVTTDEEELNKIINDGMNLLNEDFINGQDY